MATTLVHPVTPMGSVDSEGSRADGVGTPGRGRGEREPSQRTPTVVEIFTELNGTVFGWFLISGSHNTGYIHTWNILF